MKQWIRKRWAGKRWGLIAAAAVLVVAGYGWSKAPSTAAPGGKLPMSSRVFIKVVQSEYPSISGADAVYMGAVACDELDAGRPWTAAAREVAELDGRTDRARWITDAAIVNLCPEHQE